MKVCFDVVSQEMFCEIKDRIYDVEEDYKKEYKWTDEELWQMDNSMARLGENITGFNDDVRRKIVTTLNDGIVNKYSQQQIATNLRDSMGNLNRDWQNSFWKKTLPLGK